MKTLTGTILLVLLCAGLLFAAEKPVVTFHHACMKSAEAQSDTLNGKTVWFEKEPFIIIATPRLVAVGGLSSAGTGWFEETGRAIELTAGHQRLLYKNTKGLIRKRIIIAVDGKPFFAGRFKKTPGSIEIPERFMENFTSRY